MVFDYRRLVLKTHSFFSKRTLSYKICKDFLILEETFEDVKLLVAATCFLKSVFGSDLPQIISLSFATGKDKLKLLVEALYDVEIITAENVVDCLSIACWYKLPNLKARILVF